MIHLPGAAGYGLVLDPYDKPCNSIGSLKGYVAVSVTQRRAEQLLARKKELRHLSADSDARHHCLERSFDQISWCR